MHPFSWCELREGGRFPLDRAINHGLLAPHYLSDDSDEELASYVDRYLTEEVAEEGLIERCIVVCREERPRIEPRASATSRSGRSNSFLAALCRDELAT